MTTPDTASEGWAADSGHWYRPDGSPCYTVIGGNGKERATTLRDARKLGLFPSVTTIIRQTAAPGLEIWKQNQVLMAALTLPRRPAEPEVDWLKRVIRDSQEEGKAAAAGGQRLHAAVERHYRGEMPAEEHWEWVKVAKAKIAEKCGADVRFHTERSFADRGLGYGGRLDLHNPEWLLDVKTKDDDVEDAKQYDEHFMQLAAYREAAAPRARCANVFIGRKAPVVTFLEASEADLKRGWAMFLAMLAFYRAKTGHRP